MFEIGAKLREQRIAKGLSIEDIQNATKIRSWYIEAIEEGNLDKLPGKFYERAFIKTYADLVELDPEVYEQYLEANEPIKIEEQLADANKYNPKQQAMPKAFNLFKKPLFYVLLLLLAVAIYIGVVILTSGEKDDPNKFGENPPKQGQEETPKGELPDIIPDDEEPDSDEVKVTKLEGNLLNHEHYQIVTDAEDLYLDFALTGPCWVSVKENNEYGAQLLSRTLNVYSPADKIELDGTLYLHIGNAQNLKILINEEVIDLGNERVVKYITLERTQSN